MSGHQAAGQDLPHKPALPFRDRVAKIDPIWLPSRSGVPLKSCVRKALGKILRQNIVPILGDLKLTECLPLGGAELSQDCFLIALLDTLHLPLRSHRLRALLAL